MIGDGDIGVASANAGHAINNQGSLVRYGAGATRIDVPVVNTGSITVQQGTLDLNGGGISFPNSSILSLLAGTTLRSTGSITGSTTNAGLYSALGAVVLAGGTLSAPLTFEAMGTDRGTANSGFVGNFADGTIRLKDAYVKLVDTADNAAGQGAEAVYVDTLIVPAGSTLDLNGFKLYARSVQISGAVIGPRAHGGAGRRLAPLNAPTFGSISAVGEVDEWGFYGRAGQRIALTVNPGTGGTPSPAEPVLGFAEIQLVAPSGEILASASNTVAGDPVSLTLDSLAAGGNYVIRVHAPTHPDSTGNYLLAGYNATGRYRLACAEPAGDRPTGEHPQRRSLDLRRVRQPASSAPLRQRLVPWPSLHTDGAERRAGFIDQAGDSDLVTLPADGSYQIEAASNGAGYGSYAFSLDQTNQTALALGTLVLGHVHRGRVRPVVRGGRDQWQPPNLVSPSPQPPPGRRCT